MSNKNLKGVFIIAWIILLFTNIACQKAPSQYLYENISEEDNIINKNNEIIFSEILAGKDTTLNIDMQVNAHNNEQHGIYETAPVDINVKDCLNYLVPEHNCQSLIHLYDNEKYLIKKSIVPPINYEYTVLNHYNENKTWSVQYDEYNNIAMFSYIPDTSKVIPEAPGIITRRKHEFIVPESEQLQLAEKLSFDLFSKIFGESFTEVFYKDFSGIKKTASKAPDLVGPTQVYVVTYKRSIENLQLLYDKRSIKMGFFIEPSCDELEVWVYNNEIIYATGNIREIYISNSKKDIISAKEAFQILKTYFETAEEKGNFTISIFELMYYPTFIDEEDYKGNNGAAHIKYIPVWVIASGERILDDGFNTNGEYVLIIDAITGKIVNRKKA